MTKIIELSGIESSATDFGNIAGQIVNSAVVKSKYIFIHLNMHNFYVLSQDRRLLNVFSSQCRVFFEGIGMKIAAFLTGQGWNIDTNGTDLFPILFDELPKHNLSVYLLGGSEEVIQNAVCKINANYPKFKIAGFRNGYISDNNLGSVCMDINKSGADILVLGMGMKNESEFILANYNELNVGAVWCVGGLFDFISGNLIRAPFIIRKIRMEWLFRFMLEPRAKFRRTIITPFWFFVRILIDKYLKTN
jgi:N-acetylglucosaminyldiphosphoundecaprenol N-acetyl-beta-D-mannosaminyltransferase